MPSLKRLNSVCHSLAHHAVSGLSYVHPHVRRACREMGLDSVTIDLRSEHPYPQQLRAVEPLRLSLLALKAKSEQILHSEGFGMQDIIGLELEFWFLAEYADDYSASCRVQLTHTSGRIFTCAVDHLGRKIPDWNTH